MLRKPSQRNASAIAVPASLLALLLCGCMQQAFVAPSSPVQSTAGTAFHGTVHGGLQPIKGAAVQLYAVGTTGDGSAATSLINSIAATTSDGTGTGGNVSNSNNTLSPGSFIITGDYTCPSATTYVYITVTGGNAGGSTNSAISLMAALGQCQTLASTPFIDINELSTVAAVYALSPFITSASSIGSSYADSLALAAGFTLASQYQNFATGSAPGTKIPVNKTVPTTQLNTIADVLSSCVNTNGSVANGTPCGTFFQATTPSGGSQPTDTLLATLDLALNPTTVSPSTLFGLVTADAPYAASTSAPSDWTVAMSTFATSPLLATGDTRTVTQPVYPAICATLTAQFPASSRTLTGASAIASSSDDTTRIQAALNSVACKNTGKAVELAVGTGTFAGYTGFFSGLITANGEGLIIDSGVTLYGNDQYVNSAELVLFKGTNSSLMGPGTIDGRSDIIATSNTPRLVEATPVTNFVVYNVTLSWALHPSLYVEAGNGVTVWNLTVRTPANQNSADGVDIDSSTNVTVTNSSIAAGDDGVAVKNNSANSSNVTVQNNRLYGTHGLTIGSIVGNTVSNVLFQNNYVYGNGANFFGTTAQNNATTANAINIKTYPFALTVQQITYLNTCITTAKHLIIIQTNYSGSGSGTGVNPSISDVVINGVTSTASQSGTYTLFYGYSAADPITAYLANVSLDSHTVSGNSGNGTNQYTNLYLYNSNLTPTGTGMTNDTSSFTLQGSAPTCAF